jgi:hypothetical protein
MLTGFTWRVIEDGIYDTSLVGRNPGEACPGI